MLTKLWLKQFRNLKETLIEIEKGQNLILIGPNNQGKTNFLEALYLIANAKSPRTPLTTDCIQLGKPTLYIGASFTEPDSNAENKLYFKLTEEGQKQITLNDKQIKRTRDLQKKLPIEFVSADIIEFLSGPPEPRRTELDEISAYLNPEAKPLQNRVISLLRSKRILLKEDAPNSNTLMLWNQQLSDYATQVKTHREAALKEIIPILESLLKTSQILDFTTLKIKLIHKSLEHLNPQENYKDALFQKLSENTHKEIASKSCLYGPHRDDFELILDDKNISRYLSRGINRITAILFKLSKLILMARTSKQEIPILLLDDSFSEVDQINKEKLVPLLESNAQLIYATTLKTDETLFENSKLLHIKEGILA